MKIYVSGNDLISENMEKIGYINVNNEYVFDDDADADVDINKIEFIERIKLVDLSTEFASMDIELFEDGSIVYYEEGIFSNIGNINNITKDDVFNIISGDPEDPANQEFVEQIWDIIEGFKEV